MSISVACPCGKKLRAKEESAGKKIKCPGCGQLLVAPEPPLAVSKGARGPSASPGLPFQEAPPKPAAALEKPRQRKLPPRGSRLVRYGLLVVLVGSAFALLSVLLMDLATLASFGSGGRREAGRILGLAVLVWFVSAAICPIGYGLCLFTPSRKEGVRWVLAALVLALLALGLALLKIYDRDSETETVNLTFVVFMLIPFGAWFCFVKFLGAAREFSRLRTGPLLFLGCLAFFGTALALLLPANINWQPFSRFAAQFILFVLGGVFFLGFLLHLVAFWKYLWMLFAASGESR